MNAPKSLADITREVAMELRARAGAMGRGELPRFLYLEAAKLLEGMEETNDEIRSAELNDRDSRPEDTGDAGAGDRRECTCRQFKEAGTHARGCEEWAPAPPKEGR